MMTAVCSHHDLGKGSCAAIDCPENSDGNNVPSGCTCKTGGEAGGKLGRADLRERTHSIGRCRNCP